MTANEAAINLPSLEIFPNPTTDVLHIKGLSASQAVAIIDMKGQVLEQRILSPNKQLVVDHLPAGPYLLWLNNGQVFRFIKQ